MRVGGKRRLHHVPRVRNLRLEILEARLALAAIPLPGGAVSWWRGEGNALDSVGTYHGTLLNGASTASGFVGQGFNFDGIDDQFTAPAGGLPMDSRGRTVELWVRIDTQSVDESFFASYGTVGSEGTAFSLGRLSNGLPFLSNWGSAITGSQPLSLGTWHHLAATVESGPLSRLYINGVQVAAGNMPLSTAHNNNLFYLGRQQGNFGDSRRLDGMVDEVTVYDRALTAAEILSIYQAGTDGKLTAMAVSASTPAPGSIVSNAPTEFVVHFAHAYDLATVQATDLTVNGLVADSFVATDADTIAFRYTISPVAAGGQQTMAIAAGSITTQTSGVGVPALVAWTSTFEFRPPPPMTVTSSSPAAGSGLSVPPTEFVVHFAHAYDPASVQAADLTVNGIAAHSFVATDADTVTFRYNTSPVALDGMQTMAIAAGAIATQIPSVSSPHVAAWAATFDFRPLPNLTVELVAELNPGTANGILGDQIVAAGGIAFFRGRDTAHGGELWKSDGTVGGTALVKDIRTGPTDTSISAMADVNGSLIFAANDYEIWKSNGTAAGTVRIKDMAPVGTFASINELFSALGKAFFRVQLGAGNEEVWVTDGTEAGTVKLKAGLSDLRFYSEVSGQLYFKAFDPVNGGALWKTDGTPAGTAIVKSIRPGTPILLYNATNVNGRLFFQTDDGVHGTELWMSDGTTAGTVLVKDIIPGGGGSTGGVGVAANVNGAFFFQADGGSGGELWKSDGTAVGTVLVKDIWPGPSTSIISPNSFANGNGTLFFRAAANEDVHDEELWKSDGTQAGTVMVKDIRAGDRGSSVTAIKSFGNGAIFFARDGSNDQRVWYSDGTEAGTVRLADALGTSQGSASGFTVINGNAFFVGHDNDRGVELRVVRNNVPGVPFAPGGQRSTIQNTPLLVTLPASDPENDPLAFRVVDVPQHGTLSGTAPNVTYTPATGFVGADSFTYQANDGTNDSNLATIAIVVIDNAPVASDLIVQARESRSSSLTLTATNPKGLPLTFSIVGGPSHGSLSGTIPNLTYSPTHGYFGADTFVYHASDGQSTSNIATVSINVAENRAPVADDVLLFMSSFDPLIAQLSGNDADGDPLTYQVVAPPRHGTVVPVGGQLKYVPAATDQVEDFFTYQASDGLAVSNVANAVILLFQYRVKVFAEDGAQDIADVGHTLFASVPPGGSPDVSFTTSSGTPALFSQQPQIDSSGTLKFTPAANAQGTAVVTVVLHSGAQGEEASNGEEPTATFEIEIGQRYPWQNDTFWSDGNDDDKVTSSDALLVIDYINGIGPGPVSDDSSGPYYDISGNNYVTALDALSVINLINAVGAFELGPDQPDLGGPGSTEPGEEGEPAVPAVLARDFSGELYSLLAADLAEQLISRRKRV